MFSITILLVYHKNFVCALNNNLMALSENNISLTSGESIIFSGNPFKRNGNVVVANSQCNFDVISNISNGHVIGKFSIPINGQLLIFNGTTIVGRCVCVNGTLTIQNNMSKSYSNYIIGSLIL